MGKLKGWILLSCTLLASACVAGQPLLSDSLRQRLMEAGGTDSVRTLILFEIGQTYLEKPNPDSALFYLHRALQHARKGPHTFLEARSLKSLASLYNQNLSQFDSALTYARDAHTRFLALNRPDLVAECLLESGIALSHTGKKNKALMVNLEAARLQESIGRDSLNDRVYINIAAIFLQLGKSEQHDQYIRKAQSIARQYQNQHNLAIAFMALAGMSKRKEEFDSTLYFSREALKLSKQLASPTMIGYAYLNLAEAEAALGNFDRAEAHYLKILEIPTLSPFDHTRFTYFLGKFYVEQRRFIKAQNFLQEAAKKAETLDAGDLRMNILSQQLTTYEQLENYREAYNAAVGYISLAEEIHTTAMQKEIEALTVQFETEKKEKEIIALRAKNVEQQLSLLQATSRARQRLWWGTTATLFLLVLAGVFGIFINNSIHKARLAQREASLREEKLRQLKHKQRNVALNAMLRGEEFERSRLAQELHDGIGIMLSSLKLALGRKVEAGHDSQIPYKIVDKASSELRRIAQNMMPEALLKFGLIAAVEDMCDEINFSKEIHVTLQHFGMDLPIFDTVALQIYRILQELLNNIIKHAAATTVLVQLIQRNGFLYITVEDNGSGFDPANYEGSGLGLRNLRSRVNYLNGEMSWDSNPGKGTTVTVEIQLT